MLNSICSEYRAAILHGERMRRVTEVVITGRS